MAKVNAELVELSAYYGKDQAHIVQAAYAALLKLTPVHVLVSDNGVLNLWQGSKGHRMNIQRTLRTTGADKRRIQQPACFYIRPLPL